MIWNVASLFALLSLSADAFLAPSTRGLSSCSGVAFQRPLFVVSSEVDDNTEASAEEPAAVVEENASEDDSASTKRTINRERHTLFVGNLPFGT
jgi:hypothetical protein